MRNRDQSSSRHTSADLIDEIEALIESIDEEIEDAHTRDRAADKIDLP